jgi:KDO2-lipid IV(A) lauroyltransferase
MIYWLHRFGVPLSRIIPLRISYGLCTLLAPLIFLVWREKRETTINNMMRVLGNDADPRLARRMARAVFINYGKYLVDMLRLTGLHIDDLERRVTINGWEHFVEARDQGKGLIFVGGHIGNSDLAAALLARRGFPVHVITEPLQPPKWDALVQAARAAAGMTVVPLGSSAIRLLRVLRERGILAVLIDRPMQDQGVAVRFFGDTVMVPAGAAALALKSDAQILVAYIVRSGNSYTANISPAISLPLTNDPARDLQALTQAIFDWLEGIIRQYPDQWFMFRPMWAAEADA